MERLERGVDRVQRHADRGEREPRAKMRRPQWRAARAPRRTARRRPARRTLHAAPATRKRARRRWSPPARGGIILAPDRLAPARRRPLAPLSASALSRGPLPHRPTSAGVPVLSFQQQVKRPPVFAGDGLQDAPRPGPSGPGRAYTCFALPRNRSPPRQADATAPAAAGPPARSRGDGQAAFASARSWVAQQCLQTRGSARGTVRRGMSRARAAAGRRRTRAAAARVAASRRAPQVLRGSVFGRPSLAPSRPRPRPRRARRPAAAGRPLRRRRPAGGALLGGALGLLGLAPRDHGGLPGRGQPGLDVLEPS